MRSPNTRQFFRKLERMDVEERLARLRWIEYTVRKRVEAATEPLEFEYVSVASLHALLTCSRDMIPVEFWRPDDITQSQGKAGWQLYS